MPTADEPKARDASPGRPSNGDANRHSSKKRLPGIAPTLVRLTMIGWFVAASIAVGAIAGWWLDARFDTAPLLLISGVLIGVAVALTGMVRMLQRVGSD